MMPAMNVLVVGGTGTQGSRIVLELLARGERPRVLTRSPARLATLPTNVQGVLGDTTKPESLLPALAGVDAVVLITALSPTEQAEGLAVIEAMKAAGIRRLVFLSIHDVEKCPEAPHFLAKIRIQEAIVRSSLDWTFVMPNNFYDNDHWYKKSLLEEGLYPQPFGDAGVSRVDVRDIAEVAATVVTEPGHEGQRYPLVGPDILTATETAALWGRHLGREVRYGGNDLEAWAREAKASLPAWQVDELRMMYAYYQKHGLPATHADLRQQAKVLRHPPRRFEDFVKETAAVWRA
jgi:uncharacterized protein YbjT (DUF2867 family)